MVVEPQKKDKSGLWILAMITIAMLCVGLYQVRYQLFAQDRVKKELVKQIQSNQNISGTDPYLSNSNEAQDLATLQQKDTDSDGLSDFEEQYVDATSPYLADSDSDGISDSVELTAGTNPNCPEGESCAQVRSNSNTNSTSDAEAAFASLSPSEVEALRSQVTPAEVRKQLIDGGIDADVVNALSDTQVMQMVDDALNSTNTNTVPTSAIDDQVAAIRSMTLEEKKSLLTQAGVTNKTIESLSTDQINALVEQALQDAYKSVTGSTGTNTNRTNANSSNTNSK